MTASFKQFEKAFNERMGDISKTLEETRPPEPNEYLRKLQTQMSEIRELVLVAKRRQKTSSWKQTLMLTLRTCSKNVI